MHPTLIEEVARQAYFEGYKLGYHVENYTDRDRRVSDTNFERWWEANYE